MINLLYISSCLNLFLYINLKKSAYKTHIIYSFKNKPKVIINVILTLIDIILTKINHFYIKEELLD